MTPAERKSISNAIWCCSNHGSLIDRDSSTFTADLIKKWKHNQERRTSFLQSGMPPQMSFFSKVTVSNLASISSSLTVDLAKTTVLLGDTGTGKTLLCEVIAALSDSRYLERWIEKLNQGLSSIEIEFFGIEPKTFKTTIQYGQVHFFIDDLPTVSLRPSVYVQYLSTQFRHELNADEDFWQQYSKFFGLAPHELSLMLKYINDLGGLLVHEISTHNSDLIVRIAPGDDSFTYHQLSEGEKQLVSLDIALRLAKARSQLIPTILIIEQNAFPTLDKDNTDKLLEALCGKAWPFQTILTFHNLDEGHTFPNASIWKLEFAKDKVEARNICP